LKKLTEKKHTMLRNVVFVSATWHIISGLQGFLMDGGRSAEFIIRPPLLYARVECSLRLYSLRVCQVLAFCEVWLRRLRLLGQAMAQVAAFLAKAGASFVVLRFAGLSVAMVTVWPISTIDEAMKKYLGYIVNLRW
jgi:hypothetical protein